MYAWHVSDQLLRDQQGLESCYFAAQTMRTKVNSLKKNEWWLLSSFLCDILDLNNNDFHGVSCHDIAIGEILITWH